MTPDGTTVPPASEIVVSSGTWTIGKNGMLQRNGTAFVDPNVAAVGTVKQVGDTICVKRLGSVFVWRYDPVNGFVNTQSDQWPSSATPPADPPANVPLGWPLSMPGSLAGAWSDRDWMANTYYQCLLNRDGVPDDIEERWRLCYRMADAGAEVSAEPVA